MRTMCLGSLPMTLFRIIPRSSGGVSIFRRSIPFIGSTAYFQPPSASFSGWVSRCFRNFWQIHDPICVRFRPTFRSAPQNSGCSRTRNHAICAGYLPYCTTLPNMFGLHEANGEQSMGYQFVPMAAQARDRASIVSVTRLRASCSGSDGSAGVAGLRKNVESIASMPAAGRRPPPWRCLPIRASKGARPGKRQRKRLPVPG